MPEVANLSNFCLISFFLPLRNIKREQTMKAIIWLKRLRERQWKTVRSLRVKRPQFGFAFPLQGIFRGDNLHFQIEESSNIVAKVSDLPYC